MFSQFSHNNIHMAVSLHVNVPKCNLRENTILKCGNIHKKGEGIKNATTIMGC
jgi:hypothetical protein